MTFSYSFTKAYLHSFALKKKTKMCREHVDAGHRGGEHAIAAVVCVTDVEHGMREYDDLVFKWVFVRRCVGIEGYYGF